MAKKSAQTERREQLREELWPGSSRWIWSPNDPNTVGFVAIPRLLPLILMLIRLRAAKNPTWKKVGDPSSVYLDMWSRDFGTGLVTITDEGDAAYSSGYASNRAVRTWRAHVRALVEQGWILSQSDGLREFGQILLLDPLAVCRGLRERGEVPDVFWATFLRRAGEIRATIPEALKLGSLKSPLVEEVIAF